LARKALFLGSGHERPLDEFRPCSRGFLEYAAFSPASAMSLFQASLARLKRVKAVVPPESCA